MYGRPPRAFPVIVVLHDLSREGLPPGFLISLNILVMNLGILTGSKHENLHHYSGIFKGQGLSGNIKHRLHMEPDSVMNAKITASPYEPGCLKQNLLQSKFPLA